MEIINYLKRVNGSGHIVEHVGFHESGDYLLRFLFSESENSFRQHKYEVEKEYNVIDKSEVENLERQNCGRNEGRYELKSDYWRGGTANIRTCSYCGGLHPMDVIKIIKEEGFGVIGQTDKNYKWYINSKNGHLKYYRHHDTQEFIESYNQLIPK